MCIVLYYYYYYYCVQYPFLLLISFKFLLLISIKCNFCIDTIYNFVYRIYVSALIWKKKAKLDVSLKFSAWLQAVYISSV